MKRIFPPVKGEVPIESERGRKLAWLAVQEMRRLRARIGNLGEPAAAAEQTEFLTQRRREAEDAEKENQPNLTNK